MIARFNVKDFSIGAKICFGFGVTLALLTVLAVISFTGVRQIVHTAGEVIKANQFDGKIAQIELNHRNWAEKLNMFISDERITIFDGELNYQKCNFGRWLYGRGRREAEAMVPALAALLIETEIEHRKLHDSAKMIVSQPYRQVDENLPAFIAARELDLLKWITRLDEIFLRKLPSVEIETDDRKDSLGIWLYSETGTQVAARNQQLAPLLEELKTSHSALYKSAERIKKEYVQADPDFSVKLNDRFSDLREWTDFLSIAIIEEGEELGVETDPTRCAVGQFLTSDKTIDYIGRFAALNSLFPEMHQAHENMHRAAKAIEEALQAYDKVLAEEIYTNQALISIASLNMYFRKAIDVQSNLIKQEKAVRIYESETLPAFTQIRYLLHEIRIEAEHLLERSREVERIYAQQTLPSLHNIRRLLTTVREEARGKMTTDKAILSASQNTQSQIALVGILAILTGTMLFFHARRLTQEARQTNKELEELNQLQNGLNSLNETMRGEHDLPTLAKRITGFICNHLKARIGAFYLVDENHVLQFTGGYAQDDRSQSPTRTFRFGEGLVGQAALERKRILLNDCPQDYIRINSGLGEAMPTQIVIFPLTHYEYVHGVIELGTFETFSDQDLLFIDNITESIAITIGSAQSRARTAALLERTQQQSEELQSQQEELRTTNEELEERSRSLQESEEELKTQSEELQATNEELEEKTEFLEKRQQELEKANKEIVEKARELDLASKYKSEFLANMSHEIRSPLNSLLILAKTLSKNEEGNLSQDDVESAEIIYSAGHDLLNLINDILDLSKVEAGKLVIHKQEVEVSSIVHELKDQYKPLAKDKGLQFDIEIAPDVPVTFHSDGQRVGQILKNLLSNGIKFTQKGSVHLKVFRPENDIHFHHDGLLKGKTIGFSVIDTGIGIPENAKKAIFEAFQQADGTTSRKYGGTGLGLTISRELARLLDGEIHLHSAMGQGSTFTLYLPLRGKDIKKDDLPLKSAEPPVQEPESPPIPFETDEEFMPDDRDTIKKGDKTMLIVEDDYRFARMLMDLSHKKGYKCLVAGNGGTGLHLASQFLPSAIILDLGLPDMDGHTVLSHMKRNLATRPIPLHIISARDQTPSPLQQGAIGYLTKPVTPEALDEVFAKIEDLLASSIKQLLVVEDDEKCIQAITALIKSKDINITCVRSGAEAYEQLRRGHSDLVILDLQLPDMNGFELLKKASRDPSLEIPPVIVYTGRELTQEEYNELSQYAKSIVVKGVNSPERLLDETLLFLHSVESSLPQEQRDMIRMMHDDDKILQGRKILLVDDDLRNTFTLSKVLQKQGLNVVIADNGQLALEKLEEEQGIELVFMDIMMPVMDGYETIRRIRSRKDHLRNLPIIALTAKAMPEDRALCMDAGANDYMTKPIDLERILSLLRVWLYK